MGNLCYVHILTCCIKKKNDLMLIIARMNVPETCSSVQSVRSLLPYQDHEIDGKHFWFALHHNGPTLYIMHCIVINCSALESSTKQYIALQHTVLHCSTLHCIV